MKVSLCMIVRDEAGHLEECLTSVRGLADELVVVDTGSHDQTREIARAYGAHVHDFPWCDDFAAARNQWFLRARGEWLFWLDADDRLPMVSRAKLERLFDSLGGENVGYTSKVTCPGPDGRPMFETLHVRLFRNDPRLQWQYPIHEQVAPSIRRTGGVLRATDIEIVHTGYTAATVRAKTERNLRLLDRGLECMPLDTYLLSCRAEALIDLGRSAEALVSLNLCDLSYRGRPAPPNVPVLKAQAYAMQGELDQALDAATAGLSYYPTDSKMLLLEAQILAALGRYDEAESRLRAQLVLEGDSPRFGCADRMIGVQSRHCLAELLLQTDRFVEAEREARQVCEARPSFGFAWLTLGEAIAAAGDEEGFAAVVQDLGGSNDGEAGRAVLNAARHRRCGRPGEALALLQEALFLYPEQTVLHKAHAAALFEVGAEAESVQKVISHILTSDPLCLRTWAIRRALSTARRSIARPTTSSQLRGQYVWAGWRDPRG